MKYLNDLHHLMLGGAERLLLAQIWRTHEIEDDSPAGVVVDQFNIMHVGIVPMVAYLAAEAVAPILNHGQPLMLLDRIRRAIVEQRHIDGAK